MAQAYTDLLQRVQQTWLTQPLARLAAAMPAEHRHALKAALELELTPTRHGDLARWQEILEGLPRPATSTLVLDQAVVQLGSEAELSAEEQAALRAGLLQLCPWRKGPFSCFGIELDAEWRSNLKWQRVASAVNFDGKYVLDVGSGNGYSSLRALGAGANAVLAIDPSILAVAQLHAVLGPQCELPLALLPLSLEQLPSVVRGFDVVMSMGVLSHRRDPFAHLDALRGLLNPTGSLLLETLVLNADSPQMLVPAGRYAAMRNVWQLPSPSLLLQWLQGTGFRRFQLVDVSRTTPEEQRTTPWMSGDSLASFLDPTDPERTREGHPAPHRAVVVAQL